MIKEVIKEVMNEYAVGYEITTKKYKDLNKKEIKVIKNRIIEILSPLSKKRKDELIDMFFDNVIKNYGDTKPFYDFFYDFLD